MLWVLGWENAERAQNRLGLSIKDTDTLLNKKSGR